MKLTRSLLRLVLVHLSLMAAVGVCVVYLFFQYLLPILTHHDRFITVPHLKGISLEEVDAYLAYRNLRFEITKEVAYSPDYPPMTVLQQHPKAGVQVKEGRKIYLTLNTQTPLSVKMPNLVDGSVRNARVCLKSHGLLLGTIKYLPDIAQNAVLEQWYQGQEITAGTLITQGAKIDLVVGAGLGKKLVQIPQIVGIRLAEAETLLLNIGLKVGNVTYTPHTEQAPDTILQQRPNAGEQVRIGESVDVWLVPCPEDHRGMSDNSMLSAY